MNEDLQLPEVLRPERFATRSSMDAKNPAGYATLGELAERLGRDKSGTRKLLLKLAPQLSIEVTKSRLAETRGQPTLIVSRENADRFVDAARQGGYMVRDSITLDPVAPVSSWVFFYIIQLVPDLSQERVKLGYASGIQQRLADHRTASPTAELAMSWPCKSVWELAAIASITRTGCRALSQEVFDCDSLVALLERACTFFDMMPKQNEE